MTKIKIPLTCPCDVKMSLQKLNNCFICVNKNCEHNNKENGFPIIKNIPIMISETRTDTVCSKKKVTTYVDRSFSRFKNLKKNLLGESETTISNCNKFCRNLFLISQNPKVLIIGGAEKSSGTEELLNNKRIEIHSTDIYITNRINFVCDSHYLCLEKNFYDGVWIQAVLEHVVEPQMVVSEIYRVLKVKGIVYAETPFMQQVHEGAYDFNRFTVLGHRYLFKNFELIQIGGNRGPEVVFAWSTKYLIWSLTRSKIIAKIFGVFFLLIMRFFKPFISKKSLFDGSSEVFFLGKKTHGEKITHKNLIDLYKGQF